MSASEMGNMASDWATAYDTFRNSNTELAFPSETLIRLFRGDYLTGQLPQVEGKRLVDVGFGNGNNTAFFCSLGMDVHGVEIHPDICRQAAARFGEAGLKASFETGTNRELPYPDEHFDFLVSWNVLHYEGSEEGVVAGLREYARVLKPGGRLILSTTGPEHKILLNSETLGGHRYRIGRPGDFRQGQVHFFFDAPNYIDFYFGAHFAELKIGRIHDDLFRETLDWWLVTGVKPGA